MNSREISERAANWAMSKKGCLYSQEKRNQDQIFDCSSLVARAYSAQGKRWRYGGTIPRSNQEVYDDEFELIWPAKYSEIGCRLGDAEVLKLARRPGDLQFLCTDPATTRANRITHVTMVADAQTIIHAKGRSYGVCTNALTAYAGKVCAVLRYDPECTLRNGMKGFRTLALQRKLIQAGQRIEADGEFGNETESAVFEYQRAHTLASSGEADADTLRLLGLLDETHEPVARETVRIIGRTVNVRSGPGTSYSVVSHANQNDVFESVHTDGWLPIRKGNTIVWVSTKYAELEKAE